MRDNPGAYLIKNFHYQYSDWLNFIVEKAENPLYSENSK